ncbi:hypothetical protein HF319_18065, partial [Xanthomonas sp. Kuri4-1]
MGTFSLWQLVALAVVVFGVVVPAVLAAWLIRLGSRATTAPWTCVLPRRR